MESVPDLMKLGAQNYSKHARWCLDDAAGGRNFTRQIWLKNIKDFEDP